MSEQFNNKDYGDYFSAIQKNLERKEKTDKDSQKEFCATQNQNRASMPRPFLPKDIKVRPWVYIAATLLSVAVVCGVIMPKILRASKSAPQNPQNLQNTESIASNVEKQPEQIVDNYAKYTDNTAIIANDVIAQNIIVVNCDTNTVVAERNATARCYPASTTKIMTILTAADYITDYNDTFTFSYEITDPFHKQGATMAGFLDGEAVNMTDLFYGAILPSGADATAGIAIKVAGSEEEFVKLMNKKAKELGLKNTNFTNASGLFDENHYTTPEDMAIIVREAMKHNLCREVLSTYQYTTAATAQHPEGILLTSTLFSYMYGTEPEGSDILGGKTGFVNESGYCIASFGKSDGGTEYVCVTFKGTSHYPCVYDQIKLYTGYAK